MFFFAVLFYDAMRPRKDYYVVQRLYFDRLYEHPWRGKQYSAHCEGFEEYIAAKVWFDLYETTYIGNLDDGQQDAEHSLFLVPARTKLAAIARLEKGKASDKRLLHRTDYGAILKRRTRWKKVAEEQAQ